MGCRCFWDQNTDNYAEETFTNVRNPESSFHIALHRLSLSGTRCDTYCDVRLTLSIPFVRALSRLISAFVCMWHTFTYYRNISSALLQPLESITTDDKDVKGVRQQRSCFVFIPPLCRAVYIDKQDHSRQECTSRTISKVLPAAKKEHIIVCLNVWLALLCSECAVWPIHFFFCLFLKLTYLYTCIYIYISTFTSCAHCMCCAVLYRSRKSMKW